MRPSSKTICTRISEVKWFVTVISKTIWHANNWFATLKNFQQPSEYKHQMTDTFMEPQLMKVSIYSSNVFGIYFIKKFHDNYLTFEN